MKLSCTQENLARGVSLASRIVSPRVTLPVLGNILLATDHGRLKIAATDLEIGMTIWVGAKIEQEGSITLPARILQEFVATNTDKTITIELKDQTTYLHSPHFDAQIKGIEASEFPLIPQLKTKPIATVLAPEFLQGITQTAFACAQDETKPVLAGVLLQIREQVLKLVATDSYRLAEKTIKASESSGELTAIVPLRAMAELSRILTDRNDVVSIASSENQIQFMLEDTQFISRLIEGTFPNYQEIIPKEFKTKAILPTQEFSQAIRMASYFARESANNIKLELKKPKKLEIRAVSPQVGENTSHLEANITGTDTEIAFNAKFISDMLGVIGKNTVELNLGDRLSPGILKPEKSSDYLYLIMPLRVE